MSRKGVVYSLAGLVLLLVAGLWAAWRMFPAQVFGLIERVRHPVSPTQEVHWNEGPATPPAGERPPNIVLIVADDLGINDLSSTGTGVVPGLTPTPNIDAIAQQGAFFQNGYAANATCSPSRAALMTGRYPTRFGFEFTSVPIAFARTVSRPSYNNGGPGVIYHSEREADMPALADQGVPPDQITIAKLLRTRGYHTVHIGKWHLGEAPKMRPEAQGFDESLGFMAGASKYLMDNDPDVVNAKLPWDPIDTFLWNVANDSVQFNGSKRFHVGEYMTDYFTHQAQKVIRANRNRPFFLYLAYNAPHTPFQAKKEDYDAFPQIKDHNTRVYASMIHAVDRGVGEVMAELKREGIDDNTMVIFTSDNGGAWYAGLPDINKPYRGWKATFFEGGIRVPYFLRWPGKVKAGQKLSPIAHHLDFYATAAAAAGAQMPTDRVMDSDNLLPYVTGAAPLAKDRTLYWRSGDNKVVRVGNWKLQIAAKPNKAWLYDLSTDPTEQHNLVDSQPERVKAMRALIAAHDKEMVKPIWPALIEAPVRFDVPLNAKWKPDQDYAYWSN